MANWDILKSAIAGIIKTNGNQEITGQLLQNVLNNIVSSVGENATFAGIATPDTNPGAPDGPVFYLAGISGAYSNFGVTLQDEIAVIANTNNSSWVKSTVTSAATTESAGLMSVEDKKGIFRLTAISVEQKAGKNLFNSNKVISGNCLIEDGSLYHTGSTTSENMNYTEFIPIKGSTTYTASSAAGSNGFGIGYGYHCFYDSNFNFIGSVVGTTVTFTTPSDAVYIRCSIRTSHLPNAQLEEGSVVTEYEEFNPIEQYLTHKVSKQEISQTIGNSEEQIMSQKASTVAFLPSTAYTEGIVRQNLYNPEDEDIEQGYFLTSSGNKQAADSFAISGYIPLSQFVKNLILSVNGVERTSGGFIVYYNQNKDFISSQAMTTSAVATWFEGVYYVRFSIRFYKTGNIQIEAGNIVTSYLPYKTSELKENVLIGEDNLQKYIIGNENIKIKAVDTTQLSFTKQNLFNPNDPNYVPDAYFKNAAGELGSSTNYAVSGYIPFTTGQMILSVDGKVSTSNGGYNIYYNENKEVIGYSDNMSTNQTVTWFKGVAFVRFSIQRPSLGNVQIERGNQVTEYIPYTETALIPDEFLEGKTLHEHSVDVPNMSKDFDMTKSINLLDLDSCKMGKYSYISSSTKEIIIALSNALMTSGFIKVKPNTEYAMSMGHSYVPFDKDKVALIDANIINAGGSAIFTTPDNCEFIIVNMYMYRDNLAPYNFTQTNRLYEGNIVYPYTPYGVKAGEKFSVKYQPQTTALLGSNSVSISAETLAEGETLSMLKKDFPKSIKQNQISFTAKITEWGGGLQIGRGFNVYNSCYFIITDDKIELYRWEGSNAITLYESVEHRLSFQEYISIVLSERDDKALLVMQTLTNNFIHEFKYRDFNGPAAVLSLGASLSNCKLSICNPSLKSPLWMFGDSYYGSAGPNRQLYWLKQWGMLNCLVQGYGGQGSEAAYQDLVRCLSHGKPKYLVWSLGMNDDNRAVLDDITTGVWYEYYIKVRQLCELNDIELILTTIPEVRGDYPNKDAISEEVRSSGLRYIDVAKAVGSNANGEWYGNGTEYDYQSTDNVHPSQYGASAIATQFLLDFPEIMQY